MRTSSPFRKFLRSCLLFFPLLVLAAGCGGKGNTVSGKVYYKGKVLTAGAVRFFPEGQGGNFSSGISSDGSYSISNLPSGTARISVISGSTETPEAMKQSRMGGQKVAQGMEKQKEIMRSMMKGGEAGAAGPQEHVALPEKYGDPERSDLKVDITGSKQVHDIKIE